MRTVVGHRPGRRRRRIFLVAIVAAGAAIASSCAAPADPAGPDHQLTAASGSASESPNSATRATDNGLPAHVPAPPAGARQLVTVTAPSATSTEAVMQGWQRAAGGTWSSVLGPVPAGVGQAGIGKASESSERTPAGTFGLPSAFGRAADPGTRLPYAVVGGSDWWVSDIGSPRYNTHQRCAQGSCPFDEQVSENLGRAGASYDHAVVIGYNTAPVTAGAGSAFFLHVDAGVPSAGCVVVARSAVIALLRWLDPAANPMITIGVG